MTKPPRNPGGRPRRSDDGPSANYPVRLSPDERALQLQLAAFLGCSESDVLRRGLVALAAAHGI